MSETKILEHVAMMTELRNQGVRAETTQEVRRDIARQLGVRIPGNQTPLNERDSWTLPDAAKVFGVDYEALRIAANLGLLTTYRPRTRRGTLGRRHVTRAEMNRYLSQFEE